jgi:hypothetical protein
MTDTKNNKTVSKSSTIKVVDKQSLYKHLYSLIPFELLILAAAGLSWLIVRDTSCLWMILGIGQALIIGSIIMGIREYSASLVVQKMKKRSTNVEKRGEILQEEVVEQRGNNPEFKISATYALDLPKLSTNEQDVFDSLSRNLKREYVLWSINIWSLSIVFGLIALYEITTGDGVISIGSIQCMAFMLVLLFLNATIRGKGTGVLVNLPRHLTAREPRGLRVGLIAYISIRAILYIAYGNFDTFLLTIIAAAFATHICTSMLLFGLSWKVKRQGFATVNMLALWVFGTQNIWDLLEYLILPVWRKLGNLYLIRGGEHILTQVSLWDSLMFPRGKDRIISKTPEQITQRLNEFKKKSDRSFEYRFNTLVCGDNSWQFALHALIDDADLIVMHLSNFSPSNQGCIYELEQLINRVPVNNFYLLVDRHSTDYGFLLEKLRELWKRMKSSSPNHREQMHGIQIIFLEHAVKTPEEVESIYKEMNSAQQNALDVLANDPHKKELVMEHETRKTLELEGLFRALFARAVQLGHTPDP